VTDVELIAKKLAFIETCVRELESLARPELIATDVRERRFVEHTLQIAIRAALDVASHVVSDERLGEPRTNRAMFDLLAAAGWLSPATLRRTRHRRPAVAGTLERLRYLSTLVDHPPGFASQAITAALCSAGRPRCTAAKPVRAASASSRARRR
jgi:uncharacterized protein YutE (UPF0331/DUF86 family)